MNRPAKLIWLWASAAKKIVWIMLTLIGFGAFGDLSAWQRVSLIGVALVAPIALAAVVHLGARWHQNAVVVELRKHVRRPTLDN